MTVKLKGSSDGSVSLTAPADTSPSGTDITLTLPTDAGSANQFIKNSGTAGTLDYSSMVEDSSGNVGIGDTSPSDKLSVSGGNVGIYNTGNSHGNVYFYKDGTAKAWVKYRGDNSNLIIGNESDAVTIKSSGKIGVNVSSPDCLFHVRETGGDSVPARITTTGALTTLGFETSSSANSYNVRIGAAGANDFVAYTNNTERMRIHGSGYITVDGPTNYSNIQFKANGTVRGYVGPAGFIGGSDTDFGMRAESGGAIVFYNGSAEKARLNSGGNFLVGTSTADGFKFKVTNGAGTLARFTDGTSQTLDIRQASGGIELQNPNNGFISFKGSSAERMRVDSSGRLLINATSSTQVGSIDAKAQIVSSDFNAALAIRRNQNGDGGPSVLLCHSRGTSNSSNVLVNNGDGLGNIRFFGADATGANDFAEGAAISAVVDGTPGSNNMPTRLEFKTTAANNQSPTERMRIDNLGNVTMSTVSGGQEALTINRVVADGTLISFKQAGTVEGNISVSGSTVSYNGAHLTRWSQLPGNAERITILRGTVLSNIDEMCEWGDEDNEQLNRTKVSEVEGDPNVAGVFQSWDDSDEVYTNDFYCAMTGDFIIRIAQGTTVARGDLLMSAGDGTAKPQDDDIVRSKTIAKVTSTNVTCTYDDGSYCVPCVLMAC